MFAPAACAVLHVTSVADLQRMHPLTVSHNWGQVCVCVMVMVMVVVMVVVVVLVAVTVVAV